MAAATLVLAAAACGSGDGGQTLTAAPTQEPQATAQPPATPAGERAGMDGFRAFAVRLEAALAGADLSFLAQRAVEQEVECTGSAEPRGACVNQPAGTVVRGIPSDVAQAQALQLVPRDNYVGLLQDWLVSARPDLSDDYTSGALTLMALAHRPAAADSGEAYQAILTEIYASRGASLRQARILGFQFLDGGWRLTGEVVAAQPETAAPWLSGDCGECYDQWERWEGSGQ